MVKFSNIRVAILAGGLGTRLRPAVQDRPKVMALIHGRPFLTYLLDQINRAGLKEVVLCTGHMGKFIELEMGPSYKNLSLRYSCEREPLGTGGALRRAADALDSDSILVMNGDSYCRFKLDEYWSFHERNNASASLLLTFVSDTGRYGRVSLGDDHRVLGFEEKGSAKGRGWINAGVYLIRKKIISEIPDRRYVSLEKEIFPSLIGKPFCGFMNDGPFLDIGTPGDLAKAESFMNRL
ncbi:MAG: nucleotidyltransferase family protein [Deltaproteobacteria bacterium]